MGTIEKDGAAALVVLALLFLIWRSAKRRKRGQSADAMVEAATAMLPAYAPVEYDPLPTGEIPRIAISERVTPEMEQFIDDQPAEVASVLRSWLRDGTPLERAGSEP